MLPVSECALIEDDLTTANRVSERARGFGVFFLHPECSCDFLRATPSKRELK